METLSLLSNVTTIVKIAQDITRAAKTVSRNRESCQKLAERVRDIGDLLNELDTDGSSSSPTAAAATRRMVNRLERALGRALKLVCSCQGSISRRYSLLVGGQIDEVNAEIDRCLLDLAVTNLVQITSLNHKLNTADGTENGSNCKGDGAGDEKEDEQSDTHTMAVAAGEVTTIVVATPTVVGAGMCMHQLPPPTHGCYHWHCTHGLPGGGYYVQHGGPYYIADDHSPYSDSGSYMFSDDNPNACSIL